MALVGLFENMPFSFLLNPFRGGPSLKRPAIKPRLRIKIKRRPRGAPPLSPMPVGGIPHDVIIAHGTEAEDVRIEQGAIHIQIPSPLPPKAAEAEAITLLRLAMKKQARAVLPARLGPWAALMGARHGRVIVTDTTGRWGSCNHANDIRLNWRLLLLPPDLMDYVIAHELAHVAHKNHSRAYWSHLGQFMPDYPARRARLRAFERTWRVAELC